MILPSIPALAASEKKLVIDAHAHVFTNHLRLAPLHRYIPHESAPIDEYLALLRRFGFTGGVIIQPSFLGTDNSYLLSCLRQHPGILRGVIVIDPRIGIHTIEDLHHSGCTGIRLNLFGLPDPPLQDSDWKRILARMHTLGWHVELHVEAERIHEIAPPILAEGVRLVIDHFGRPSPSLGIDDPGFRYLLSLGPTRQVWVKISAAYRNGNAGRGQQIALAAIPLLKRSFGLDHLLWGSDWPHTQFETVMNYQTAYDFLLKMLPDPQERQVVLGQTPGDLYFFS
ncbi:MAG TPA: amidohydrolase family protein [Acidobacteriaceae bacterium]|nr:amidohydrolase family protein [Acidobacteriaceae bacterium]